MNLNFLKGIGNQHLELGRLMWFASFVSLAAFAGYAVIWNKEPFLPHVLEFGGACAAILAAGGFGVSQKETAVAKAAAIQSADAT